MKRLILPFLSLLILLSYADGRTWTNQAGQSFEGELVEVTDKAVTIRRQSDRRKFTMPINDLSGTDQDYLKEIEKQKKNEDEKKRKSSKDYVPTTPEELAEWLIGTEWYLLDPKEEKVAHFLPDGVMAQQLNTKKWDKKTPAVNRKYNILSANSIKYGVLNYTATFSKNFNRVEFINPNGNKGEGRMLRRFE